MINVLLKTHVETLQQLRVKAGCSAEWGISVAADSAI